jgi:PAS domain S-box-containing protein
VHPLSVGLHAAPAALPRASPARWGVPVAILLVLPLSWLAIEVATFGGDVALWWPAAAAAVLACAATPSTRRPLTAVAVALMVLVGSYLAGREPGVAVTIGLANGLAGFVGGSVLGHGTCGWPALKTLEDLARLLLAALATTLTIALTVATIAAGAFGSAWLPTAAGVLTATLAAILVVAPAGMSLERKGHRASTAEAWLQGAFLLATSAAVFAPYQHLPLAFLLFPALIWGGLRLAPRVVTVQLLLTATAVTVATIVGWGVFADNPSDTALTGILVQALLVTMAAVALPLMTMRSHTLWAEGALESSDDLLDNIMSATTATAVLGTALDGSIEFFNVGATELTGWSAQEVVGRAGLAMHTEPDGRRWLTITPGDAPDRDRLQALVRPFLEDKGQRSISDDWEIQRKDGVLRTVSIRISKRFRDGQVVGCLGVAHDVTDRRRQEELTEAALEAERELVESLGEVDRAKNDFLATVSHELRTPITSILGYTELLMSDETGTLPSMHQQILSRVERNGRRLMGLVEDVLTMSQIEVGGLRFRFIDTDLGRILARAVETEISVFGIAGVMLDEDVTDQLLPMSADADKLERALAAVLDNAAKYSDAGSRVSLRLRSDGCSAVVVVQDHGIGISADDQARMFDRFWRSSDAHQRAIQGAGLGLTVARSIIEGHRGTITCDSEPGRGTTITVTLPLSTGGIDDEEVAIRAVEGPPSEPETAGRGWV